MKTLYDALKVYKQDQSTSDFRQLRTALVRYVVPGLGGPEPAGARMTAEELEAGMEYLVQVELPKISEVSKVQEQVFERLNVSKSSRRNYRYQLGKFRGWIQSKNLVSDADARPVRSNTVSQHRLRSENGKRLERPEEYWKRLGFDRKRGEVLCLKDEEISPQLRQQLQVYEIYRLKTVRPSTFIIEQRRLKRYLGWLC